MRKYKTPHQDKIYFLLYNVVNVRCLTPSLARCLHYIAVNILQAPRTVVEVKAAIQFIKSLGNKQWRLYHWSLEI